MHCKACGLKSEATCNFDVSQYNQEILSKAIKLYRSVHVNCTNCVIAPPLPPPEWWHRQVVGCTSPPAGCALLPSLGLLLACLAFKRGSHGWSYTSSHLHQQPFHISSISNFAIQNYWREIMDILNRSYLKPLFGHSNEWTNPDIPNSKNPLFCKLVCCWF